MPFYTKGKPLLLGKQIQDVFPPSNCFHYDLYYITFYLCLYLRRSNTQERSGRCRERVMWSAHEKFNALACTEVGHLILY